MSADTGRQAAEPEGDELTVRIPPRFWWLKRICIAGALLLVALALLRWWSGYVAHGRLQAEIERVRAAGEPILPEDFDPPPVADADNAALVLTNAANSYVTPPGISDTYSTLNNRSRLTPAQLSDAQLFVNTNGQALRLARQARDMPAVDWGVRLRTPVLGTALPFLSGQRTVGKLLHVAAKYHHQIGNDAEAIATLRDLVAHGRALDQHASLIGHLVAISLQALASRAIEGVAPDLVVQVAGSGQAADAGPAIREAVKALIAELLDERETRQGFIRAFQAERMFQLDVVQAVAGGELSITSLFMVGTGGGPPLGQRVFSRLFKPMLELGGVEMMRYAGAWVEAAGEPNWPAHHPKQPLEPRGPQWAIDHLWRPLSAVLAFSFDRAALLHYRALADGRMAAVALAVRLYEIDHSRRPMRLADLVPNYLGELPLDPFREDGGTFGYRPDAKPPVLYSVGPDGVDDGGRFTFRQVGGIDREVLDMPFFLDGNRPETPKDLQAGPPASEQSAEDEHEAKTETGDADEDQPRQRQPQERQGHPQ